IDQLTISGGSNAVLQVAGNVYVGHHGNLNPGDLRVGSVSTTLNNLNGVIQGAGWQLGVFAGDSGNVTMTGGAAFITNTSATASLIIGNAGSGVLQVNNGSIRADVLRVSQSAGSSGLMVL